MASPGPTSTEIERLSGELRSVESRLADTETYRNLPADELDALLREAGKLRSRRELAEERWLEKSEALEALRSDPS